MEENNIIIDQATEAAGDIISSSGSTDMLKKLGVVGGFAAAAIAVGYAIDKTIKFVKSKKDQKNAETESADEPTVEVDYSEEENNTTK